MKQIDSDLISVLADFFINFSVFWFGLALVAPIFPGIDSSSKVVVLTADTLAGILSLYFGYRLRKELQ
ncbi:MAG: hypothetical protein AAB414_00275 [Patescibacteria group bacterium]